LATWDDIASKYYIVEMESKARWIRFTLSTTLSVTDALQASVTVDAWWQGESPGAFVAVYNMPANVNYVFSGASGFKGLAVLDVEANVYRVVQLQC
jgi:hypothetical protein